MSYNLAAIAAAHSRSLCDSALGLSDHSIRIPAAGASPLRAAASSPLLISYPERPIPLLSAPAWPQREAALRSAPSRDVALSGSGRSGCTSALQALPPSNPPVPIVIGVSWTSTGCWAVLPSGYYRVVRHLLE